MMEFGELTLALPEALWALLVLPFLVAAFFAAERHRRAGLNAFLAPRLQPLLAGGVSVAKRRWSFFLTLAALTLAVLALAQPRWGFTWEERTSKGRDVIIAIDTSRSMLAQDLKPNRMTRAKLAAQDLLSSLDGDRAGLVAFAGTAFLQAPLTADYDAVRNALSEVDSEIIPRGGTNLTAAIETAADAFGKGESEHRALIIFTDGEELEADAVQAATEASRKFRVFTVGLGSSEGALVPVPNERGGTDFVRNAQGQYVTSRLDEARLREIAEAAGGFYVHLQGGPAEMQQIVRDGLGKMKERDSDSRFTKQPIERFQWPLAGAVLFALAALLLGERRRGLRKAPAAATAALLILLSPALHAAPPEADFNRGCEAFQAGDYSAAAEAFSVALGTGEGALQAKAAYNLANTLARRGTQVEKKEEKLAEWKNALQHYDRALSLDPNHADAKHNRELVQKAIEDLEKSQEEQQKQDQEKKDDEKEEKKEDEQNQENKDGEQKGEEGKQDQPQKDQQQQQQQQEEKSGEKQKPGENKQEKGDAAQEKEGEKKDGKGEQKNEGKEGEQKDQAPPEPAENQPTKQGELKAGNPQQGDPNGAPEQSEAAKEAAAAAEGRMTEKQAKALLQAIQDARPRLLDPREMERQRPIRGFKDW